MRTSLIGKRIKDMRQEKGITQRELAELIGVSMQTVWRWENTDREPDVSMLLQIAGALRVPTATLLDIPSPSIETQQPNEYAKETLNLVEGIRLPILSEELTACCGEGIPILELTTRSVDFAIFPRKKIGRIDDLRPPFLVNAEGDSMSGFGIPYGTLVAVNPAEEVRSGNIGLVCIGDRVIFKKIYIKPSGFELVSSDGRPPTIISKEDFECGWFKILGRGMGAWADLDQEP